MEAKEAEPEKRLLEGATCGQYYWDKELKCAGCKREFIKHGWAKRGCKGCKRNGLIKTEDLPDKFDGV